MPSGNGERGLGWRSSWWRLATGDGERKRDLDAEAGERGFEGRGCRRLGGDGEKEKVGFGASELGRVFTRFLHY
jgi:hypothetical protein